MPEPIRKLGRYELLEKIAKGGMGEIYLARTRGAAGFEKSCIIKTILPHLAEEEEFIEKFLDEGRIVVQLVHGNIVPVFDMGEEEGEYFLAMEYIAGRDLRDVLKRVAVTRETVPCDLALFITSEVCKGLDYAHRKTNEEGRSLGIVHRDVSPSNILISREGEVKLIDFGIARAADKLSKTISGRIQGKFCYMSPEQASGQKLDGRSDIFSVGVVLYELLTGFRPFEGDSDLGSLDLVRKAEFDPPSTFNAEIPDEIDAIVAKALAKDPDDRYRTIDQLQVAILQYLYTTGTSPTSNDLQAYLSELFQGGLERKELRAARESGPPGGKPMSLDDALDFELGLLEDRGDIDPHQTTAVGVGTPSLDLDAGAGGETKQELQHTPSTAREPVRKGPVVGEEPATPPAGEAKPRRLWPVLVVLGLVAIAAALAWSTAESGRGTIAVQSDPPGARIVLDGVSVLGKRTPHTLEVDLGPHEIRLEKDGYESRTLTVAVTNPGARVQVSAEDARLREVATPKARSITVTATPPEATLFAGDAQIGRGSGAVVLVKPDETLRVEARLDGCKTTKHLVNHSHPHDTLQIQLDCSDDATDAGHREVDAGSPKPEEPDVPVSFTIDTAPSGAEISVNGVAVGTAPVEHRARSKQRITIEASMEGYKSVKKRLRVGSIRGNTLTLRMREQAAPRGCLNVRLQYPGTAEIAVDGDWIPGPHNYRLERHMVGSGERQVRVRNTSIEFDQTYPVTIAPGSECALLVVDER